MGDRVDGDVGKDAGEGLQQQQQHEQQWQWQQQQEQQLLFYLQHAQTASGSSASLISMRF